MIFNSLKDYEGLEAEFIKIIFLDYLIGNTDRHQSNWGILKKDGEIAGMAPIYDNGSSLCSYIPENQIDDFLGTDRLKFNALVDTKSRSRIRIDKHNKKEPTHLEVIEYLKANRKDFYNNLNNVNENINRDKIRKILDNINEISVKRKELIEKYILKKIELINKV